MKKYFPLGVVAVLLITSWAVISNRNKYESAEMSNLNTSNTIVISDNGFTPARVTIKQGGTVTFINQGKDIHWPASDDHPTHEEYSEFDSKKPLNPGAHWSFTFNRLGVWKYHDHLYPSLSGVIIVEP